MDGTRFDQLIKRLVTQRVSRLTALRGLAAGAVAVLTGVNLTHEEAGAAKDKPNKRRICVCSSFDPATCDTKKKSKKAARRTLRNNACAYKGRCQAGKSGCVGTGSVDADDADDAGAWFLVHEQRGVSAVRGLLRYLVWPLHDLYRVQREQF